MATRKMHALVQVHLTTANQLEIRIAYLELLEKPGKRQVLGEVSAFSILLLCFYTKEL